MEHIIVRTLKTQDESPSFSTLEDSSCASNILISFLVAVMAGVICHYICGVVANRRSHRYASFLRLADEEIIRFRVNYTYDTPHKPMA